MERLLRALWLDGELPRRGDHRRQGLADVRLLGHRFLQHPPGRDGGRVSGGNAIAGKHIVFAYRANGQFSKITRYADATGTEFVANTFYAYDNIGRLMSLIHSMDSTAPTSGWGTGALSGYQYTFDHERLWRKNLRDNNGDGQVSAGDGVDPNRNFAEHWGYDNEGSSPDPADETYRGPSAGSEPETQALMRRMVDSCEADHLVAERVWQEFARGLMEAHPARMLEVLAECGLAARLLPELQNERAALERAAAANAPLPVRFAVLAWGLEEAAVRSLYQDAVTTYPDLAAAWNNLGVLLMERQDYMAASEALKRAARLSPADPAPLENLGLVYQRAGWSEEALRYYAAALSRDPYHVGALRGAAKAARLLNKADAEALERVRTALMLEKDAGWRMFFERERVRIQSRMQLENSAGAG